MSTEITIAYFVSPHGFGHAARACAVMEAIHTINPAIRFEIFTKVPKHFFQASLGNYFHYHILLTDVGMVQKSGLHEDAPATVKVLDHFLPFSKGRLEPVIRTLRRTQCRLIICDIAPMGIATASMLGIPSVLIENFTWDWIYRGYKAECPAIEKHGQLLRQFFAAADLHIQTEPVCRSASGGVKVGPIGRKIRTSRQQIREKLDVSKSNPLVLITMGGTKPDYTFLDQLKKRDDMTFLIPGPSRKHVKGGNLILLPHNTTFFHPDLVNASEAIIGKLGYSTVVETYAAGTRFGYLRRAKFRESRFLEKFVKDHLPCRMIPEKKFESGSWTEKLDAIIAMPRNRKPKMSGAGNAAKQILKLLATR